MSTELDIAKLPVIKFFKKAVDDILAGAKTLEPRPRGEAWITRVQRSSHVRLTYGPMMGTQTVFAVARILHVEIRGLDTATQADVDRIGADWVGRDPAEFVAKYTEWYAKELAKGYCVAWISFAVDPDVRP